MSHEPPRTERTERVTVAAHAKLTVTLRVVGVRDDGYHLLDAEMVSLDLHDQLVIDPAHPALAAAPATPGVLTVEGPFAAGVPTDDGNLVVRALALAGRRAHVTIDKRIPHGGGLGGGSTDAAAVLRWAGVTDLGAAARIGADVPFCLVGGRARVRGIGELVDPLPPVERTFTLVCPPLHVSTPAVYRAWDDLGGPTADGPNDLEPAALAVEPQLVRWRDLIEACCGVRPTLAGSGATWFVEGERGNALAALGDEGATVTQARTIARA